MQKTESKTIVGVLGVLILVVYTVAFVQLGKAGEDAALLKGLSTFGSLVAAVAGLLILVDWKNLDNFVSQAGRKEWIGLILAALSLALGIFALAN